MWGRLHRNEEGTISILSIFALLFMAMLLGMVMNVGWQADGKIRMQNAADGAAYSGGVVIARGMNTLAFTNHLLFDVFAVTAFMREGRDRNSEKLSPEILAAWNRLAPQFNSSKLPKFEALGAAIPQKAAAEAQLVSTYGEWASASSAQILPLMEEILAGELIPQYQRAVVAAFPDIAQTAALEVARRHGQPDFGRGPMLGALWRANGELVGLIGGDYEVFDPSLPVVEPVPGAVDPRYVTDARNQRRSFAQRYLNDWNNEAMVAFDREGKMSQFGTLWRSFTCGYLKRLLDEEYPDTNLPFQIRTRPADMGDFNAHLEQHFMFVGVAYWKKVQEILPGLFENPLESDSLTFAQVQVFVPRSRLEYHWIRPGGGAGSIPIGGVPGEFPSLPPDTPPGPAGGPGRWVVGRQGVPTSWDLLNQHWTCQLVPATASGLPRILSTIPPLPAFQGAGPTAPNVGGLTVEDIGRINTH